MLICAHNQIPFCSNKCLGREQRATTRQFVSTTPSLKADESSALRKVPNLFTNPLFLKKAENSGRTHSAQNPWNSLREFLIEVHWHLVIHESCGHGGGHHVSHGPLRSRNICITLGGQAKHLFHHLRSSRFFTLQIWTCHAPRDLRYVATTKSCQRNPWIFVYICAKRKVNHVNLCQT